MRVVGVDVWKVVVPTVPGAVNSPEFGPDPWDQVPKFIIRLRTDEGIEGIGETGRGVPRSEVEALIPRVVGLDPLKLALQYLPPLGPERYDVRYPGRDWEVGDISSALSPAYNAFEMALYDLVGKALGVPAHFLLGGAFRDRVKADFWIGQQSPEDAARHAREGWKRGFGGIKLKCAIDDPWIERISAIVEATSPEFRITIDPNERFYRPHEAIALAEKLERFPNVEVYEDPVPKWNLDWYRQIRAAVKVPVALHLEDPRDIVNAIKAEACDCLNLGGGMAQFVRNAALVEAAGMVCWHGSGVDLGIMEHSYLHAAAASRNCVMASDFVGSWVREDDLIVEPMRFENGYAIVTDRPGLGCALDFAALEKYRVP
jgi:muconate cycloisomerase